jgi:hypothetical protein
MSAQWKALSGGSDFQSASYNGNNFSGEGSNFYKTLISRSKSECFIYCTVIAALTMALFAWAAVRENAGKKGLTKKIWHLFN